MHDKAENRVDISYVTLSGQLKASIKPIFLNQNDQSRQHQSKESMVMFFQWSSGKDMSYTVMVFNFNAILF